MRIATLVFLLLSAAVSGHAADAPAIRRFALIAGANEGGGDRVRLRYATTDAEAVARVLEELGGVAEKDALVLLDPSRDGFVQGVSQMKERMSAAKGQAGRLELVVYYSGHSDEEGLLLQGERLGYGDLRRDLNQVPADVRIAILDSCSSGAITRKKGGTMRPSFLVDESGKVTGHAFLTSSSEHEAAQESDRIGASFFTHYLLSGLRGAADATADGRVTLNEAYQFAFAETLARTEKTQSGPQHAAYDIQLAGTGDLVMTDLRSTAAGLVLDDDLGGRVYVRDSDGRLVAELFKPSGRAVSLGLSAGEYALSLETKKESFRANVTLVDGKHSVVAKNDFSSAPREATARRGGEETDDSETDAGTAAVAQPGQDYRWVPVSLSLMPDFSTAGFDDRTTIKSFDINLLMGRATRIWGVGIGVGLNWAIEEVRGAQISADMNLDNGILRGTQIGAGANWLEGDGQGIQIAGGFNYAGQDLRGVQISGGVNMAQNAQGLQISGGLNLSESMQGLQVAVVNIAGDMSGSQIGVVNIGGNVKGAQIGVVNISDNADVPIGVVSIVKEGQHAIEMWAGTSTPASVALRLGGKHFYTLFVGSLMEYDLTRGKNTRWFGGMGLGGSYSRDKLFVDADITGGSVWRGMTQSTAGDNNVLSTIRLNVGWQLFEHLGVYAGAAYNVYVGMSGRDDVKLMNQSLFPGSVHRSGHTTVRMWPALLVGLKT